MFEEFITSLFRYCVYILQVLGGSPGEFGFGYYLANIVLFVFLQPALILLFFILWRIERKKNQGEVQNTKIGKAVDTAG